MREVGIDLTGEEPKIVTTATISRADVVISMGCDDTTSRPGPLRATRCRRSGHAAARSKSGSSLNAWRTLAASGLCQPAGHSNPSRSR
jgi:protein-tyrosine-phosphatase